MTKLIDPAKLRDVCRKRAEDLDRQRADAHHQNALRAISGDRKPGTFYVEEGFRIGRLQGQTLAYEAIVELCEELIRQNELGLEIEDETCELLHRVKALGVPA